MRTSGFSLYFFSFLMVFNFLIVLLAIKDVLEKGSSAIFILVLVLMFFGWMETYFYKFIAGQKIEIKDGRLIAKFIVPAGARLLPKIAEFQIDLNDIDSVTLARLKYFEERSKEFIDKGLGNVISAYRNMFLPGTFPFPMSWAASTVPLMFITPKDKSKKGAIVITKSFSKNGFRQLIQEFKKRNVPINVEPALGF